MSLNEFDIIDQYFNRQKSLKNPTVIKGIGDDCAIVAPVAGKQLVMSMDTVVAGRHFPEDASAFDIGSRALCTSISDLAAMGAKPLWFTLGLTLPEASSEWLQQFSLGLFSIADRFNCELIGGDTTRGHLTITVQVHGEVSPDAVLERSGAMVGDQVFVSGPLGDGAAALAVLQKQWSVNEEESIYLAKRFYTPEPQVILGRAIASLANSAIDISDGLLADTSHIAEASHVGIVLHVDQLPISSALKKIDEKQRLEWALTGGDDYQLLFTVAPEKLGELADLMSEKNINAYRIGEITENNNEKPFVRCLYQGQTYKIEDHYEAGYQHFTA